MGINFNRTRWDEQKVQYALKNAEDAEGVLKELWDKGSISYSTLASHTLKKGETRFFDTAKLPIASNLDQNLKIKASDVLPKATLTRVLTGDVPPHFIQGLGRMQKVNSDSSRLIPAPGYKDVFVSSLEEYKKLGIALNIPDKSKPITENNPVFIATKLDLKDEDIEKVKENGIWLFLIHPGSKVAIPTKRQSIWNPYYKEGGATASGQREWVTPNVALEPEMNAGHIVLLKVGADGSTQEWRFWKGKLMTALQKLEAIDAYVKSISRKIIS